MPQASRSGIGDTKLKFTVNLLGRARQSACRNSRGASRRRRSARASRFRCRPASTTRTSSSTSAPTAGRSSRKSAYPTRSAGGLSRPSPAPGSSRTTRISSAGRHREQEPLASMQAHVSYTFRPRLWLALNATYYDGGRIDDRRRREGRPPVKLALRPHAFRAGRAAPVAQAELERRRHDPHRQRLFHLGHCLAVHALP